MTIPRVLLAALIALAAGAMLESTKDKAAPGVAISAGPVAVASR